MKTNFPGQRQRANESGQHHHIPWENNIKENDFLLLMEELLEKVCAGNDVLCLREHNQRTKRFANVSGLPSKGEIVWPHFLLFGFVPDAFSNFFHSILIQRDVPLHDFEIETEGDNKEQISHCCGMHIVSEVGCEAKQAANCIGRAEFCVGCGNPISRGAVLCPGFRPDK